MGVVRLEGTSNVSKTYSTKELAEMLLQVIDGSGSILIDDAEYIGQGIHKIYLDRDVLVHYSETEKEVN